MALAASSVIAAIDRRLVRLRLYRADSRALVKLQTFLAVWVFVAFALLLLNGAVELWEDGGGRGSVAVAILGWIVWAAYRLAVIVLLGIAGAAVRQWWNDDRKRPIRR